VVFTRERCRRGDSRRRLARDLHSGRPFGAGVFQLRGADV